MLHVLTVSIFLDTTDGILNPNHHSPFKTVDAERRFHSFMHFLDTTDSWLKEYHGRVWEQLHKVLREWIGEYTTLKNLQIMNAAIQTACKPWRDEPEPSQATKDMLELLKRWERRNHD